MSSHNSTTSRTPSTLSDIKSLEDLSLRPNDARLRRVHEMYELERIPSVRLRMSERAWNDTVHVMQAPRESVENQYTIIIRDKNLGHEVIFNPLRSRRTTPINGPDPAELIEHERTGAGCLWCEPDGWMEKGMWADEFGEVWSDDGRIVARANWARMAPISGMVIGDEKTHNLLRLSLSDFFSMFQLAEVYIRKARETRPRARFFIVFMNGGPKSAGSVAHSHLQIVGKEGDRHFGYAENILARCPADYWEQAKLAHRELGLTLTDGRCTAWVNLAPVKEKDITVLASTLQDGALMIYRLMQTLIGRGTNNYSLAVILSPQYVTTLEDKRFSKWPPVLLRWVDRGDGRSKHGDVGAMEFFASTVVATDPFVVANWLRESIKA
jgi:diadenosine tetraphosphate (Ap4A) HIT family hydrolase